jgi:hypothetical protein
MRLSSNTAYKIGTERTGGYRVYRFINGAMRVLFYGTYAECKEWVERNGHDESL